MLADSPYAQSPPRAEEGNLHRGQNQNGEIDEYVLVEEQGPQDRNTVQQWNGDRPEDCRAVQGGLVGDQDALQEETGEPQCEGIQHDPHDNLVGGIGDSEHRQHQPDQGSSRRTREEACGEASACAADQGAKKRRDQELSLDCNVDHPGALAQEP